MPRIRRIATVWTIGSLLLASAAFPQSPSRSSEHNRITVDKLRGLQSSFDRLAADVIPSVVTITGYRDLSGRGGRVAVSHGSGFVYRRDGLVATNHHVVEDADVIEVALSTGRRYSAELIQFDPRSDLAIIRIPNKQLQPADLGDLSNVRRGQWVFSAGNPFGVAQHDGNAAFSVGVVSAVGRSLPAYINGGANDRYYGNLIETDASINPGNSGGPLFNIDGQVIGVSTAMISDSGVDEGLGYAIPISTHTRRILDTLARGQVVSYGFLGVTIDTPDRRVARQAGWPAQRGAVITGFAGGPDRSPAARAGLRERDLITEFDGMTVRDADDLIRLVGATPVGASVEVKYYRGRNLRTTRVELIERAATVAARARRSESDEDLRYIRWRGATLVEPGERFLQSRGLSWDNSGLYVLDLERSSELYRRGLRPEGLIIRCNGQRVRTFAELIDADESDENELRLEVKDKGSVVIRR